MEEKGINNHFKRESKIMAWSIPALIMLGVVVALIAPAIMQFIDSDKCLDRGGSYNYSINECEYE